MIKNCSHCGFGIEVSPEGVKCKSGISCPFKDELVEYKVVPRRPLEALRFERFDTTDVAFGYHCVCWVSAGGPFLRHPAGCLCVCHV